MAEQTGSEKHTQSSSADPRQHNETSIGRGESGSALEEDSEGAAHASTSSGRTSNESDTRSKVMREDESEDGLTMGTNGGEKIGAAPSRRKESASGAESGEQQEKKRKAS